MTFWTLDTLPMEAFRPGVMSKAEIGKSLIMACMEIGPAQRDDGHTHAFDQCGVVLAGQIEMFIGEECKVLGPDEAYFIPAGAHHGWKTFDKPVKLLDVSLKQASD